MKGCVKNVYLEKKGVSGRLEEEGMKHKESNV